MPTYLTHYYNLDNEPFRSLSALPEQEALRIMAELADDTPFGERFRDPAQYLKNRKATEQWVREGFSAKGGNPQDPYPNPMVLGSSKWMEKAAPDPKKHGEIRIPLSLFTEDDISFTYPDSMISHWFGLEKPPEYYLPCLHGIIFTLPEILQLVKEKGRPEEDWHTNLPPHLAP
ncbi:MAG: hypothetical protein JXA25_18050 [Anaerolineales bacterium]|nr:hypothetical protein [Anaerolineales bacterium]